MGNLRETFAKNSLMASMINFATSGRSSLVVTRLPAAREDPGSNRAAGKSLCFHENHCDTQFWARAACTLTAVPRSTQPSILRGTVNEYQPYV